MAGSASPGTRWAGQVALVACTAACGGSVTGDPAGRTGAGGDNLSAPTADGGRGGDGSGGGVAYLPCTGGDTSGGCIPETLTASAFGDGAVSLTEAEYDEIWKSMCAEKRVVLPRTPASLMIVLDASATMDAAANGTGEASKWAVTRDALKAMIASLPDSARAGLLGYPNRVVSGVPGGHEECVALDAMVPVQALGSGDWRTELDDGLDAIQTEACTPTHDAYVAAVDAYPAASSPAGERLVLLITDGVPTLSLGCAPGECAVGDGYEQAVIDEIERTRTALGIETLVLGLPGSEAAYESLDNRWWLSMAAEAGGTPALNCSHDDVPYCHLDTVDGASFPAALAGALTSVADRVRGCAFALPPPVEGSDIDPNAMLLAVETGEAELIQVQRSDDPACTDGWYLDGGAGQARLCTRSCALVASDPAAIVRLLAGCSDMIIR